MDNEPNLAEIAQAFKALKNHFNHALEQINNLDSALRQVTQANLQLRNHLVPNSTTLKRTEMPKLRNSDTFKVKGSIINGTVYMPSFLREAPLEEVISVSVSYL